MENMFEVLWDVTLSMIEGISQVWGWLVTVREFGFTIPFIDYTVGFNFAPLYVLGGAGIITLITAWVVKAIVPLA